MFSLLSPSLIPISGQIVRSLPSSSPFSPAKRRPPPDKIPLEETIPQPFSLFLSYSPCCSESLVGTDSGHRRSLHFSLFSPTEKSCLFSLDRACDAILWCDLTPILSPRVPLEPPLAHLASDRAFGKGRMSVFIHSGDVQ